VLGLWSTLSPRESGSEASNGMPEGTGGALCTADDSDSAFDLDLQAQHESRRRWVSALLLPHSSQACIVRRATFHVRLPAEASAWTPACKPATRGRVEVPDGRCNSASLSRHAVYANELASSASANRCQLAATLRSHTHSHFSSFPERCILS
jgi:hypothetical protein